MSTMQEVLHLLSAALILWSSPLQEGGLAQSAPKLVVAHWLVPMPYYKGQADFERAKDDIRSAVEEGLDGFAIDAFSGSQAKGVLSSYIAAADAVGAANFKVFLSADMSLNFSAPDIVSTIVAYGGNPHYLKVTGKPLLSTYGGQGMAWWVDNVIQPLKKLGQPITFVPYFDRPSPNGDPPSYEIWTKTIKSLPSVDGLFNFLIPGSTPFYSGDPNLGNHKWSALEGEENLANALHDQGKIFMAPYMPYYWAVCHSARQYLEYQGGRGMENTWKSLVTRQKPEIVQIVTWNDYSESSFIQPTRIPLTKTKGIPSYPHLAYYELLKYYIDWYHYGKRPVISKDAVFYFYRPSIRADNFASLDPFCPLGPVPSLQLWGNPQNVIYLTTALTATGELRVITGDTKKTYTIPAGLTTTDVPFNAGPQVIEVWRESKNILTSAGMAISQTSAGDNFNVFSAYSVANGTNSDTWSPSNAGPNRPSWYRTAH